MINEICSRNSCTISDEDNKYPDWIELYNSGNEPINLLNWKISDDLENPAKWSFPSLELEPDSHLVIFTDALNRKAIVDHWETIIYAGDIWKYWIPDCEPDASWKNLDFDDSGWPEGPGGFGRGDGDDGTVLPDTVATVYIRRIFTIADTAAISFAILHVDYDDAFVAYLNGVEIARANIGWKGKIEAWYDIAYHEHYAGMFQGLLPEEFRIDMQTFRSVIHQGENVLAIQGLNAWANYGNSSLIPFLTVGVNSTEFNYNEVPEWFGNRPIYLHTNFSLTSQGESLILSDSSGNIADIAEFPYLQSDQSYGRLTDGSIIWKYFSTPSPGLQNEPAFACSGYTKEPQFNIDAGFYNNPVQVGFANFEQGDTIRYTLDGSWVTDTSAIYQVPVSIDSIIVIKAQVYKTGLLPGKVTSNTYVIGYSTTLPVVSVSLNPHDLWDWNDGIYVLGPNASSTFPYKGANFWQEWEKKSHIEYFDENHTQGFELDADIMIHGGWSRAYPMKSLRINTSGKYDQSEINYKLFKDKNISRFRRIVLRNSGQDYNVTHFRDAVIHKIVQKKTAIDMQDYQPAVVFLNGQYWGIHNIREKIDKFYVNENFGIDEDSIQILSVNIIQIEGGYDHYAKMIDYIKNLPVMDSVAYDSVSKLIDLQNFTDYFIAEMYFINPDWPNNNIKYWRKNDDTSRWRYIITDIDPGLGLWSYPGNNELYRILHSYIPYCDNHTILRRLLQNENYKRYFINRSADMFNTVLLPANILNEIEQVKERIEPEMPAHMERWGGSIASWESNIDGMNYFAANRLGYVWQHYLAEFGLENLVTIGLDVDSIVHGTIRLNSIIPDSLPWEGIYFNGNPVELSAIADSGYQFSHWAPNLVLSGNDTLKQDVVINVDTNVIFKAFFSKIIPPKTPGIVFNEINYRSADTLDAGDWIELWNTDTVQLNLGNWIFRDGNDNHAFVIPDETILENGGYLVLFQDSSKFSNVYSDVQSKTGPFEFGLANEGEELRLFDPQDNLMLSMNYSNQPPWPVDADGTGKTIELLNPLGDLSDGGNWFSGCLGGSPGGPYIPCDTIGLPEMMNKTHYFKIAPNPFTDQTTLTFYLDKSQNLIFCVFDSYGTLVIKRNYAENPAGQRQIILNKGKLKPGIYFVRISGKTIELNSKLLIR